MLKGIFIAGIGGFVGTAFRFLISRYIQVSWDSLFPWGTFIVNILGSFIVGIIFGVSEKGNIMSPEWRIFLAVGFCGGLTTFSSLSNDAFMLFQTREFMRFALYSGFSFFLGLMAVYLGRILISVCP